ncbi:MAG: hypothetical protein GWM87_10490 [Xanthomonadales bacterium]|nr:sterol desaturase family protein [Xanthomonadales bacterium]NIX13315.1 hypothetical protein [Xanthomonadales bacterium]
MNQTGAELETQVQIVLGRLWSQFESVLLYPVVPAQRIHFLYLLAAVLFAWLGVTVTDWATNSSLFALLARNNYAPLWSSGHGFFVSLVYMAVLLAAIEFTAFLIHYLQHKVSWLWAFHKVHHSATVIHPLTYYREHPVDNVQYIVGTGLVTGLIAGVAAFLFGDVINPPRILGISALAFGFNFLAYNLRHSHVWLRWPGPLNYVFGSPAHHQVHHSCHPDHIDRNFAFMFPVWDLMFGTYCLPETNEDVRFGLGNSEEKDFHSCLGLYFVPFKKLWAANRNKSLRPSKLE